MPFFVINMSDRDHAGYLFDYHRARFNALVAANIPAADMPLGLVIEDRDIATSRYLIRVNEEGVLQGVARLSSRQIGATADTFKNAANDSCAMESVEELSGFWLSQTLQTDMCLETLQAFVALASRIIHNEKKHRSVVKIELEGIQYQGAKDWLRDMCAVAKPVEDELGLEMMAFELSKDLAERVEPFCPDPSDLEDLSDKPSLFRADACRTVQNMLAMMMPTDQRDVRDSVNRIGKNTARQSDIQLFDLIYKQAHQMAMEHWLKQQRSPL